MGRENLVEKAYTIIKKKILTGELKPGEYINENRITKELSISRTPLKQAILLLKNDGLVEGLPNKSSYVVDFSLNDVHELFEALTFIEKTTTVLAARRVNDYQVEEIKEIYKKQEEVVTQFEIDSDPEHVKELSWRYSELNFEFHRMIASICRNKYMSNVEKGLLSQERLFYALTYEKQQYRNMNDRIEYFSTLNAHHRDIIDCLASRDHEKAGEVMTVHMKYFYAQIIQPMFEIFVD